MLNRSTIRRVLACVMLLVFALSITPKGYLHDLFANHTDTITAASHEGEDRLIQDGFNCDCNSLVATSPFTGDTVQVIVPPPPDFPTPFTSILSSEYFAAPCSLESRGPPAVG